MTVVGHPPDRLSAGSRLDEGDMGVHLERFELHGLKLSIVRGELYCSAPLDALSSEICSDLFTHKDALQAWLQEQATADRLIVRPTSEDLATPLAVPQERIWFLHQLAPSSAAYTVAAALRLTGSLDPACVEGAIRQLVERHDALRTVLPIRNGRPIQEVVPGSLVTLTRLDVSREPVVTREAAAVRLAADIVDAPFALASGPLCRAGLIALSPVEHILVVAIHHAVCDQWSMGVLGDQFAECYSACIAGRPVRLPALAVRYRDYAIHHRAWLNGPMMRRQLAYWRARLAGVTTALLPSRPDASQPGSLPGASGTAALDPALLDRLRTVGTNTRASLFMVLLSAFNVVLARYTGQTDLAVGVPVAGRTIREIEGLVGTFVNTLILRTDVSANPSFVELLQRVRDRALDAFANQDLSFDRLVSELRPDRSAGRNPFFQVLFNVQNAPFRLPDLAGIKAEVVVLPSRVTQFDLTVSIDTEIHHRILFTYDTSLFDRDFIEGFIRQYVHILRLVADAPTCPVDDFALMADSSPSSAGEAWNDTNTTGWETDTVVSLFERQVAHRPEQIAVVCGDSRITYAALDRRAAVLGGYLRQCGVGRETVVGICLDRSADIVVALLAILKAGGAYLPIDPALPATRLAHMVENAATKLVVTSSGLRDTLPAGVQTVCLDDDAAVIAGAGALVAGEDGPRPADLAYVLYTSGSTGEPKGIAVEHRSLANFLASMQREPGISPEDVLLSVTTLSFDIAALEIYLPLITGARVVVATAAEARDPFALADLLTKHEVTLMQATPATWRLLLDSGWRGRQELSILCGGEAMPRELADRLLASGRAVWNLYGPTETTIWSTIERIEPGLGPVSIGHPIANTQVHVTDPQLRPVPTGVVGELVIGGAGVAREYVGRPELTRSRFLPDPFARRPGQRLYRTGDLARRWPDGRLECLGRQDHQVKVRGFRIELTEVEGALVTLPSVRQAVVSAVADPSGEAQLVAFVVWSDAGPETPSSIRTALQDRLPAYMMPSRIVTVERLPLTPSGKVDRKSLHVPAEADVSPEAFAVPTTLTEKGLAQIWVDVLGVPGVGIDDDFFAVGGHSLLAVQVMAKIEEQFGQQLPLATLLEARTIRTLALRIEGARPPSPWVSLVPIQPEGDLPPFFCVHGVGGEVLLYSALAERCAPRQPFVGIRAPFYDGQGPPLETIEDQAEHYLREILAYQPNGPYYIGGYSHGGRVALELAIRLEGRGKSVAFLGIFDTAPFYVGQPRISYTWRLIRNLPAWFIYDFAVSGWAANTDRVKRGWRFLWRRVGGLFGARGPSSVQVNVRDIMDLSRLPAPVQDVYQRDFDAFLGYRPSGRCGDVTLFRSKGQPVFGSHEPDLGWHRASRGRVTVCPIAANHSSLLEEPAVADLAAKLLAALQHARDVTGSAAASPAGLPAGSAPGHQAAKR